MCSATSAIIITIVAVSCLLFCLCFLFYFNFYYNASSDAQQPLSQIRMSLAGSLGAAQVIFLGGINFTESTVRNFLALLNLFEGSLSFFSWDTRTWTKQTKVDGKVHKI